MPVVDGEIGLRALAVQLKAAGAVGIQREMVAGLKAAAAPVPPAIQAEARMVLPKAGGLNEFVARYKPRTSVKTGVRSANVRVTYRGKGAPSDRGPWRHPVFGNRGVWAEQSYPSAEGWWERGAESVRPAVTVAARAVVARVGAQVRGI